MIASVQAFHVEKSYVCATGDKLFVAFQRYIQFYQLLDGILRYNGLILLPEGSSLIYAQESRLFAICGMELFSADLSVYNPEISSTGIKATGIISLAAAGDLVALAYTNAIEIYNVLTGKLVHALSSTDPIIKVVAYDTYFAFITHTTLCQIDYERQKVYEYRPHNQANIRDKTKQLEFHYVDLIYCDQFYLVNDDGKTILLDKEFATQRWQNINEARYKAVGVFTFGDKQAIYFDSGVLKINYMNTLTFLGKVQPDSIKDFSVGTYKICFCHGYDSSIVLVFASGAIAVLEPGFVEIGGKLKISGAGLTSQIHGQCTLLASSMQFRVFVDESGKQFSSTADDREEQLILVPRYAACVFATPQVLVGASRAFECVGFYDYLENSKMALTIMDAGYQRAIKCYGLRTTDYKDFLTAYTADCIEYSVVLASSAGVLTNALINMQSSNIRFRNYDIKAYISKVMQVTADESLLLIYSSKIVRINLINGERELFWQLDPSQALFACTYYKEFHVLLLGTAQKINTLDHMQQGNLYHVQIKIYSPFYRVMISQALLYEVGDAKQLPYWQEIVVINNENAYEQSQFIINTGRALNVYSLFTCSLQAYLEITSLDLSRVACFQRMHGDIDIVSPYAHVVISGLAKEYTSLLIASEISAYRRPQDKNEIIFNDTQFDASPFDDTVEQTAKNHTKNPFQRTAGLNDPSGKLLELSSRSSSRSRQGDSFSASDVSDLVQAVVQKSYRGNREPSQNVEGYIIFDDDNLVQPIFGFKIDSEPQLSVAPPFIDGFGRNAHVLQELLDSDSEDRSKENQHVKARYSQRSQESTPAQQLLKQIQSSKNSEITAAQYAPSDKLMTSQKGISSVTSDSQHYMIDVSKQLSQRTDVLDYAAAASRPKSQPSSRQHEEDETPRAKSQEMSDYGAQRYDLDGQIDAKAHEESIPTQSETPARHSQSEQIPAGLRLKQDSSNYQMPESYELPFSVDAPQQEFANASTLNFLLTSVEQVQQYLSDTLSKAERHVGQTLDTPKEQRDALHLQLQLLQNTIERINVLYGFKSDLALKVDELTKMMGRTLGAEFSSDQMPKNYAYGSKNQLPRLNDYI